MTSSVTSRLSPADCLPRWSTPRSNRPTWGGHAAKIADALGKPLMPWQKHVLDVALEIDPDTGRLVYKDVRVTVPRQSGKSTLILPMAIWRSVASRHLGGRQRMLYAAQTGVDARRKWRDDYVVDLEAARKLRGRFRVRLANGSEAIQFRDGSTFSPTATTEKAGHGLTLDLGVLDEAFAQVDDRVDQAWYPAMSTRPQAQMWLPSTVGTAKSTYLKRKHEEGRSYVQAGMTESVAYFEWSAEPDADPEDPATWWSCMPALGYTQSEDTIRANLHRMPRSEFLRAFCNIWTDQIVDSVIPMSMWGSCLDSDSQRSGEVVLAVDVSPNRSAAAVVMCGLREDGLPHLQVVRHGPGLEWVVEHVTAMADDRSKRVRQVVIDRAGPAGALIPQLVNADVPLRVMGASDVVQACGLFYDAVVTQQVRHVGQEVLTQAISGADRRQLGDAWAWKRRTSTHDITPLVGATCALWGLTATAGSDYDPLDSVL